MDKSSPQQLEKSVFVITKDTFFLKHLVEILSDFPDFKFESYEDINTFLELDITSLNPCLFLIDGNLGQALCQEWTQSLKMNFQNIPLIIFHTTQTPLNFSLLRKNGADQLIHINFDKEFIVELMLELIPYNFPPNQVPLSALCSIDSSDLNLDIDINFDVYVHLPYNKKTILYRKKGGRLEEDKLKKITDKDQHLYFNKSEKKQFLEYARAASTLNNSSSPVAFTERAMKSKKLIFEIMSEFFNQELSDFSSGRVIFDRCRAIVQEYELLQAYQPMDAFNKMIKFTGQERTNYNEAINVSVYAAMFGHILNLPMEQIESLALAGLLHNIGLSYVEQFDLNLNLGTLSENQREAYYSYPEKSVLMIKNKKVPLPAAVSDTILEHRENMDGSGFPKKISATIKPLSKILRIAYEFQIMTSLIENENKQTASKALNELKVKVLESKIPLDLNTVLALAKVAKQ